MTTLAHHAVKGVITSPLFGETVTPVEVGTEAKSTYKMSNGKTYTIIGMARTMDQSEDQLKRIKAEVEALWKTKNDVNVYAGSAGGPGPHELTVV